jgi:hypothetical protein
MNAIDKATVLKIYKALLKSAKVFPSKRRPNIIEEIKLSTSCRRRIANPYIYKYSTQLLSILGFRENKQVRDPIEQRKNLQAALDGLQSLERYSGINYKASSLTVNFSS